MNITVANIGRLTMCGESSSDYVTRVVCNESVGFSFISVVDLKTYSLGFTSCGRNFGSSEFKATLLLKSIENVELVNCSFHDNIGTALAVYDTNITLAENSEFIHGGGGITALDSKLILIGNTTFVRNDGSAVINVTNCNLSSTGSIYFINNSNTFDSEHPAAAIWASTSSLNFVGTSNFISSKHFGWGAIYAFNHTSLSFNGTSNFINNYNGGAISACNAHLSFIGTSNFINNSAGYKGGAITTSGENTTLNFTGTSNFISNSVHHLQGYATGGAIAASCLSLSFKGASNFINNSADCGGGIHADSTSLSFMGTSNFINNSAPGGNGGGVVFISPNTTLYWENNRADYGGANSESPSINEKEKRKIIIS